MLKHRDTFSKNILVVFAGTSLVNIFNLLYQLLIAHRLSPADFAAFNSLLAIFLIFNSPLMTIQTGITKYIAEFRAQARVDKIRALLSGGLKRIIIACLFTIPIFFFVSVKSLAGLKISSSGAGLILTGMLVTSWILPVMFGGVQGMEKFKWLASASVISGAAKLSLTFIFLALGFKVAGALGAFLAANIIVIVICYLPLKGYINPEQSLGFSQGRAEGVDFKEIYLYLWPVAISTFCFMALISYDMILVKYFFSPQDAGFYSLAQMVGKIFFFLPGAISIVMFPRISGLNARNMDTFSTLKRSLLYTGILCSAAFIGYNIFPSFALKVLTGKPFAESILLGRLFGFSMSFFALLYILILYFLSKKDLRFIKYLVLFTLLQFFAIVLFHQSLINVQLILCVSSFCLFLLHLWLALGRQRR
ncbi:oligosaccharide flippase family protein [Candidatus Omnitrophota bacterium]